MCLEDVSYVLLLCIEHGSIVTCNICMSSILRLFFLIEKKDENNIYEKNAIRGSWIHGRLIKPDWFSISGPASTFIRHKQILTNKQTDTLNTHAKYSCTMYGSWFWKSTKPCLSTSLLWLVGKESKGLLLLVAQANHQEVFILEVSWLFNKFL